ncbi:MAG: tetratricopeptide repeat protein [Woeseia sp.]
MTSFVSELKRRNVLRVAAAYAVVAWIIIEAGSVLLPTFGASESAFQVYVLVVVAGFLASLVFAWVFEVTPEGVKLEKNVDRSEAITPQTGRRLDFTIIGLLIIALGISVTLNVTGIRNSGVVPAAIIDRLSIAVLPFESRSTDPDNQLFADGIHDDLLTRLANIAALKVISRTSVMEYRNTTKNLRQIAQELGVGTVLEGAVQRVGDNVRIHAQLIDASTDEHIWAKSYDRQLSIVNLFTIQSEISEEITSALKATLSTAEQTRIANVPTEDMTAYRLYLQGRANLYQRTLDSTLLARDQFEQAVELDPEYADAYAGLADSVQLLFINHAAITMEESDRVAQESLDRALELDPNLADAYASLGLLKMNIWTRTRTGSENEDAERAYQRAIELNPNHARAHMWFASLRNAEEKYDEAIELYHRSLQLDPLGRIPYANLPGLYAQLGRNEEALDKWIEAVRIHPDWPTSYQNISFHLQRLGRIDEAIAWGMKARELSTDPLNGMNLIAAYSEFGSIDKAIDVMSGVPEEHPFYPLGLGFQKIIVGDYDGGISVLTGFIEEHGDAQSPPFVMDIIAVAAILNKDIETARNYVERRNPDFTADTIPTIDRFNVDDAIRYAYILQQQGARQRADKLLAAARQGLHQIPRLGQAGHGIADVHILALQGKTYEALAALREAVDAGFRGEIVFAGWPLSHDPYLESIRDEPEYQAIASEIDGAVIKMQERVAEAEASGNWDELMALAESS